MLICSFKNHVLTYVFGMLSLSEAAYLSLSKYDPKLPRIQATNRDKANRKRRAPDSVLGFTQNQIKRALTIPLSTEIVRNYSDIL